MGKVKFCEVCGEFKAGVEKDMVEGDNGYHSYDLCPDCAEQWELYNLPGKTRYELLTTLQHKTPF